ncbi:hypothetical protein M758_4G121500 [Ceratodon purpureus]|nr:hypothetical protein M758_4G121500 [Ceratodon purpureus]
MRSGVERKLLLNRSPCGKFHVCHGEFFTSFDLVTVWTLSCFSYYRWIYGQGRKLFEGRTDFVVAFQGLTVPRTTH